MSYEWLMEAELSPEVARIIDPQPFFGAKLGGLLWKYTIVHLLG